MLHHEKQGTEKYIDEYRAEGASILGQAIIKERWNLVGKHADAGLLLDYGCGSGHFHMWSWRPVRFETYGYDFNPHSGYSYPLIFNAAEPRGTSIDILTMWDVIEHLPDPREPIIKFDPDWIFISTPNIEAAPDDVVAFKHVKPGEHIHYFSLKSMTAFLWCLGYRVVDHNFDEGALRNPADPEAILSIAAKKAGYVRP